MIVSRTSPSCCDVALRTCLDAFPRVALEDSVTNDSAVHQKDKKRDEKRGGGSIFRGEWRGLKTSLQKPCVDIGLARGVI